MIESVANPGCIGSMEKPADNEPTAKPGQSMFMSVYRTKLAGHSRLITITWCKNLLLHELSISVQAANDGDKEPPCQCKVELKPWSFWRKQGSKHFDLDGKIFDVVWDLKAAKFDGPVEPRSNYYIAVVCEEEVVLLVGDMKKDAYRRTRCRPSLKEPTLLLRREHLFGKKSFCTRVWFDHGKKGRGEFHNISIKFIGVNSNSDHGFDPELEIQFDGKSGVHVQHLQWKFRGNDCIDLNCKNKIEIYWDVHDWLFGGPRKGLFMFKPLSSSSSPKLVSLSSIDEEVTYAPRKDDDDDDDVAEKGSSGFCLILYAWKLE